MAQQSNNYILQMLELRSGTLGARGRTKQKKKVRKEREKKNTTDHRVPT